MNTPSSSHVLSALGLCAVMLSAPALADTPVIVNGGFEQQTLSDVYWNQSTPTGWTLLVPSGEGWNSYGGAVSPAGGQTWAVQYLTGWAGRTSAVGIEQTVSGLTIGNSYEIDFYSLAAHDFVPSRWNVTFGDMTQSGVTQDANQGWNLNTLTFVASSSSQLLTFASEFIGAVSGGSPTLLLLDGVTIKNVTAPVPEASTFLLFIAGLTALRFISRRRSDAAGL